jgi:methenyltetrahydromethanopterin cyclohydrolase
LSVNSLAWKLLARLLDAQEYYGVKIEKSRSGTILVDAGVEAKGGFETGRLITEICMGGCGKASITGKQYGKLELPTLSIHTDHPIIATLGSQYAGWQIREGDYFAIGSGPARALAQKPKRIFEEIGYKDSFDRAVMVLEAEAYPSDKLIAGFAADCHISPENLAVIITPTTSLAGMVQIAGRIIETGVHKLRKLGLIPNRIMHAWGWAPIPPLHPEFTEAMARSNDAILYGGTAFYIVEYDDEGKLRWIVENAPSKASNGYGKPFISIFKEANSDFYKVDSNLFAPASISVCNNRTGRVFKAGEINPEILARSFGF